MLRAQAYVISASCPARTEGQAAACVPLPGPPASLRLVDADVRPSQ